MNSIQSYMYCDHWSLKVRSLHPMHLLWHGWCRAGILLRHYRMSHHAQNHCRWVHIISRLLSVWWRYIEVHIWSSWRARNSSPFSSGVVLCSSSAMSSRHPELAVSAKPFSTVNLFWGAAQLQPMESYARSFERSLLSVVCLPVQSFFFSHLNDTPCCIRL